MTDKQKAMTYIKNFLQDDTKKTLLIKGYDSDAKVRAVLSCLNKSFNTGIIRTGSMANISSRINRAFNRKLLPSTITSTKIYPLGNMKVYINSYSNITQKNPRGNEKTFTIFYPVQTVLDNLKRYKNYLKCLNKTSSRKIILITTNEWGIKNWDIEQHVDSVFFYSVENDNPQLMINLRNNKSI